jgi:hypothetical protein
MIHAEPLPILPSGQVLRLEDPSGLRLRHEDFWPGIARQARYAGQAPATTLLQHLHLCVLLARQRASLALTAYAAAHDLHEVYVGDLIAPWKAAVPAIREIEARWEGHVHRALGLDWPHPPGIKRLVKEIDVRAVAIEATVGGHPHAEHHRYHCGGALTAIELRCGETALSTRADGAWHLVLQAIAAHTHRAGQLAELCGRAA